MKSGIFNDLEIFFNDGFLFNVVKSVDNVWSMISSFLYDVDTGKSIKYINEYTNINIMIYCSTYLILIGLIYIVYHNC